jgi:CheY-like chemotaxis protein
VNYQLSFLDDAGRIRQVREAHFESEHNAMCWMWIAGGVWALEDDWSVMELRSKERCTARVPAKSLCKSPNEHRRVKPRIMIVDSEAFGGIDHEGMVRAAGYAVAEFFFDSMSAVKWLNSHRPDAAVIDVRLRDKSCVELAKKLFERKIPFLAVSNYPADVPGLDPIFRSIPWFEKPLTSAGLQLALGCIL